MSWSSIALLLVLLLAAWRLYLARLMRKCTETADLRKKRVVLTGGTAGFGLRVLLKLVEAKAEKVLFVGRDADKGAEAVEQVKELVAKSLSRAKDPDTIMHFTRVYGDLKNGKWKSRSVFESESVLFFRADLSDLEQVGLLSAFIRAHFRGLDILLNNAGAIYHQRQASAQGLEMTLAGNTLGHALLVNDLMGLLRATRDARIVHVSSCFHRMTLWLPKEVRFDYGDVMRDRRPYDMWYQYSLSKLGINLLAKRLAQELEAGGNENNLKVVSVFPGICLTSIMRGLPPLLRLLTDKVGFIAPLLINTVEESCQSIFTAVFMSPANLPQAAYFENCRVAAENPFVHREENVHRFAAHVRNILQSHRPRDQIVFPAEQL